MSDIFDEVEESLRQERALNLWKRFQPFVVGGAALIVGATLVVGLWQYFSEQSRDGRVRTLESGVAALEGGEYETAINTLGPLARSGKPIAPVAAQYLAQAELSGRGDVEAAKAALTLAMQSDDEVISDVSRLKLAYLGADTMAMADLEALLAPLRNRDNAMETLAIELIAAKAYADGDFARARQEYGFLRISPNAPEGVKNRANAALEVIPPSAVTAPTLPAAVTETEAAPETVTQDAVPAPAETETEDSQ